MLMSSPFKTNSFKKLFERWNKKLEKSGHKDIENFALPEPALKKWEKIMFINFDTSSIISTEEYFSMAQDFLNNNKFHSKIHEKIWELHCEGLSVRQIENKIKKKGFKKSTISNIIINYRRELRTVWVKHQ